MTTPLLLKTKDIKYTMTRYNYDSEFLKSVGHYHATYPNVIAGIIAGGKYRSPPVRIVKEDGTKMWKADPVEDDIFTNILNTSGRTGNWIVTYGNPHASETHMVEITTEELWRVEEFDIYASSRGAIALVTSVDSD